MATEVVKTVGTGGDYTDLQAFADGEARDLVTADEIAVAEVLGSLGDVEWNPNFDQAAWVTDTTRYVIVRPAAGAEHNGNSGSATTRLLGTSGNVFGLIPIHLIVTGGFEVRINNSNRLHEWRNSMPWPKFEDVLLTTGINLTLSAARAGSGFDGPYLYNCMFRNNGGQAEFGVQGHDGGASGMVGEVFNCTLIGWDRGVTSGNSTLDVRNTVAYDSTTSDFSGSGYAATCTNNASGDATAPGSNAVTSITDAAFVDRQNQDFTPATDGVLHNAGADLSTASWPITDDFVGTARPVGSAYDIGAIESTQTGSGTVPQLTNPTATTTGETTASGSVDTDTGEGTLYWIASTSATKPSVAQIQAGQDHTDTAAPAAGNQAVSATGTQDVNASGLSAGTTYYFHFQQSVPG